MTIIPYTTFVPTYTDKSTIPNAGDGLFSSNYLEPFTRIGYYPGKVSNNYNSKSKINISFSFTINISTFTSSKIRMFCPLR